MARFQANKITASSHATFEPVDWEDLLLFCPIMLWGLARTPSFRFVSLTRQAAAWA
jgi:hypothetical protein